MEIIWQSLFQSILVLDEFFHPSGGCVVYNKVLSGVQQLLMTML